ncbi:MAG TPA: tetratricopeptide repeat protein, partial [Acidimicrobiales bacterium]|nr:tetratricopeptide repeat protein [Acidimicrobiales bacterium]
MGEPLSESLSAAERALARAVQDPASALEAAERLLATDPDPETAAVAARAAGVAELHLGRRQDARRRLSSAREAATAAGLGKRVAEIQLALAVVLLQDECPGQALDEMDRALELADDPAIRGKVQSQRATVLMRLGRTPEALAQSAEALATCGAAGLEQSVAQLHSNRGLAYTYLGDFASAERELTEAHGLLRRLGSDRTAAQVLHNLGYVAGRQGDIPRALRLFDEALAFFDAGGIAPAVSPVDRCEVLLAAWLLPEARQAAEAAVEQLESAGMLADVAEARLVLADASLAMGDAITAEGQAEAAATAFGRQGRPGWQALARFSSARARWATCPDPAAVLGESLGLAGDLDEAGWTDQALECRIRSAQAALDLGECKLAADVAGIAARVRTSTTWHEGSRTAYAAALAALAEGDVDAAQASLSASIAIAAEHAACLGDTELRASSTATAAEPAALGLRL